MASDPIYRFRFYDDVRKRWIVARYFATEATIKDRYARYELIGEEPRPSPGVHGNAMAHFTGPLGQASPQEGEK